MVVPTRGIERWHGTPSGYSNHLCACAACRAAWAARQRELRARRSSGDATDRRRVPRLAAEEAARRRAAASAWRSLRLAAKALGINYATYLAWIKRDRHERREARRHGQETR